jgi:enoyl-CoA hydratase
MSASFETLETYSQITMDDGKANAFSFQMIADLNEALDQAFAAGKPIVLRGRSGMFCAGLDLTVMQGDDEKQKEKLLFEGLKISYRILASDLPVVCLSQGHALAMGGLLLLSGDYRIAENVKGKIGLTEVAVGVEMPEYGVDLVKDRVALPYQIPALANAVLYDPKSAIAAGFVDEVVETDGLAGRLEEITTHLSSLNAPAHVKAKKALRAGILGKYEDYFLSAGIE